MMVFVQPPQPAVGHPLRDESENEGQFLGELIRFHAALAHASALME